MKLSDFFAGMFYGKDDLKIPAELVDLEGVEVEGVSGGLKVVKLTQSEYEALFNANNCDPNTFYIIVANPTE